MSCVFFPQPAARAQSLEFLYLRGGRLAAAGWVARERAQALELAALEEELRQEEELRLAAAAANAPSAEETHSLQAKSFQDNKKKKQRKCKPSPEMITFLRSKRERTKALKAVHAAATARAVGHLGELELDALEEMGLL